MSAAQQELFHQLFADYKGMVLQVCKGFLQTNPEAANDLMQEVFVNTWLALPKFRGEAQYKTWIYRITVNTCLQYLRKQKSRTVLTTEMIPDQLAETIADEGTTRDYNHLYKAIGQLESIDRLIIMMVLDELSYPEISTVMGITEATLRVKVHRIKQRLKKILDGQGTE